MPSARSLLRSLRVGSVVLLLSAAACTDMPTGSQVYQHAAAGELWTAVSVPDGVPGMQTWLPFIQTGDSRAARTEAQELRRIRGESATLRRRGDLAGARLLEEQAALRAARGVTRMPPAPLLGSILASLERWCTQVEAVPGLDAAPRLRESGAQVRLDLASARASLAAGDTLAAVEALALASARVRDHAPDAVALAAIERVEALVDESHAPDSERARHLLVNAREALAGGNYPRAFWRALYALQLTERGAAPVESAERID
jgi:hypothetical protein